MAGARPQQPVSAQVVGDAFVKQYYRLLHQSPGLVHMFYHDISKVGRPEEDGSMSITTTMEEINSKILSLNYDKCRSKINYVDAQDSLNGGVSVLVTGNLTGKDNVLRKFAQSFFLAPQLSEGYFVLNDMFRYIDDTNHEQVIDEVQEEASYEIVESDTKIDEVPKKSYASIVSSHDA